MNFTGKVAVSTGAASGMGLLFAENFAALGGNVVLCDVNEAALTEKVAAINERGAGKALGVLCDVRDYAQVCAARDKAVAAFGRIDVMANFAGGTAVRMCKVDREKHPEFPDVPIDVYDWGIDVNLKGPFYFAHAVLKQMREQKCGLIINIGSITGAEGDGYGMDYPTSKAGLMYGQIGQTEYIIKKVKEETGISDMKVVATGGLGRTIADETDAIDIYDSALTLDGLRIIYEKNRK